MEEYERVKKEALLTEEEMKAINDGMPSSAKYGDVFKAIAQAQVDNTLKTDGIEIRSKDQSLPKVDAPDEIIKGMMLNTQQDMLKAGFVKVIKKE